MAQMINKKSDLESSLKSVKIKLFVWSILTFISFAFVQPTRGISFLFCVFSFIMANKYAKQKRTLSSGVKGECSTRNIAGKLPDTYSAIPNVKVTFEDKSSEMDLVVIGPNGCFIIETKNLNGQIEGSIENKMWTQYKTGRKGGHYSKEFYNPIKQVSTHVYRLSHHLKENGINVWTSGIVYFANSDADVTIDTGHENNVPVFSYCEDGEKSLIDYITNYEGKQTITNEVIIKIIEILK